MSKALPGHPESKPVSSLPAGKIKRRATRLEQTPDGAIYQFALTGEELLAVADISKISRDDAGKLIGYQRPEVKHHVQDIVDYLNGDHVLFPHAVIVAFSSRVKFTKSRGPGVDDGLSSSGTLTIPIPKASQRKPGWIVDGQQRSLAVAKSKRPKLPIPICAFITDDVEIQREQFLRINNSKPLPKGLVTELLPEVRIPISATTSSSRLPSVLVNSLNQEADSPFFGLIKRASSGKEHKKKAVIPDGPLIRVLRGSLISPSGCLFSYRNFATGEADIEAIWNTVLVYWTAVRNTFPDAWGKPPSQSRLMHSAGLWSMGRLMDRIMPNISLTSSDPLRAAQAELEVIRPVCRWTRGRWEELGGIEWNRLENVSRHVSSLSNFLIRYYVEGRARNR